MTEAEWLEAAEPAPILEFLQGKASDRKLRLFGVACARRIAHVIPEDLQPQQIVDVNEAYADGLSNGLNLNGALAAAVRSHRQHLLSYELDESSSLTVIESIAISAICALGETMEVAEVTQNSAAAMGHILFAEQNLSEEEESQPVNPQGATVKMLWIKKGWKNEYTEQSRLLRDIFPNPFRPVAIDPDWRASSVISVARNMYDSRDFSPMPLLADALQDAGCENEDILNHCRGDGTHVRGCWVVDLILNKS